MKSQKLLINGNFLKVNGKHIMSNGYFAYDGCHKIYIIEDEKDIEEMFKIGWEYKEIYPIEKLEDIYFNDTCSLRFIESVKLDEIYVPQLMEDEDVIFEYAALWIQVAVYAFLSYLATSARNKIS